jgi:hypothetical protein
MIDDRKVGYTFVKKDKDGIEYGPNRFHPMKGKKNGRCNRRDCQSDINVFWQNTGNDQWYCQKCAFQLNTRNGMPNLCVKRD